MLFSAPKDTKKGIEQLSNPLRFNIKLNTIPFLFWELLSWSFSLLLLLLPEPPVRPQ